MIRVEQVTKEYQISRPQQRERQTSDTTFRAVDRVSFACTPGRVFSLLGPNGAGKTTLLRMIATLLQPSSGDIIVEDKSVLHHPAAVRARIGFLTGSTHLYDRLTPSETVKYFADLHGMSRPKFAERKAVLFDQLDIHPFANRRVGQLSTGMKQRVSIARSMIHDPAVVIFDEPTSGLDVISADSIIQLIRRCREEQKTVIFSSHIMSEVDLLCDDLAIINHGQLIYHSPMEEFRQLSGQSLTETFIRLVQKNHVTSHSSAV